MEFGNILEKNGKIDEAYRVYRTAFESLPSPMGTEDLEVQVTRDLFKTRINIASNLGRMCKEMERIDDEEMWLVRAFEDTLKVIQVKTTLEEVVTNFWETGDIHDNFQIAFDELQLPQWFSITDFIGICIQLTEMYGRKDDVK